MVSAGSAKLLVRKTSLLPVSGSLKSDAAQRRVEVLARVEAGEHDGLIADQSGAAIDRMRIATLRFEIRLGARDEEAARLVQAIQPLEVDDSRDP